MNQDNYILKHVSTCFFYRTGNKKIILELSTAFLFCLSKFYQIKTLKTDCFKGKTVNNLKRN